MSAIKHLSVKEFRELGFLQEVNRTFLHPRGLALAIVLDMDGNEFLAGIWDYRDHPEGIVFDSELLTTPEAAAKRDRVEQEYLRHLECRIAMFGTAVQEITP